MTFKFIICTKLEKYTLGDQKMKRREILYHIDCLIGQHVGEDKQALKVAKQAVSKEYRYKFWTSIVMTISLAIIFGSFVLMSYFMYCR